MLNGLDLFSGIGGMSLALRDYVRTIAYCEIDAYCQGVLLSRQVSGDLCAAPIWDDVKTLSSGKFCCKINIISAGFPCQDISIAGLGKGLAGERSGLFFEILRLAKEIKPNFIFLENVPAIRSKGGLQVVREIAELGYDCKWCIISAKSVGAPHKRERWFLLAYSKSQRFQEERQPLREETQQPRFDSNTKHTTCNKREEGPPAFYRMDDDVSYRVDRVKALGNAVVPDQAKKAFEILMGINEKNM